LGKPTIEEGVIMTRRTAGDKFLEEFVGDEAHRLLISPEADRFTKALDSCGWMIVPNRPPWKRRWHLNEPSDDCPDWCLNGVCDEGRGQVASYKNEAARLILGALRKKPASYQSFPDKRWRVRRPSLRPIDGGKRDEP
jgi:hypothetical protein